MGPKFWELPIYGQSGLHQESEGVEEGVVWSFAAHHEPEQPLLSELSSPICNNKGLGFWV